MEMNNTIIIYVLMLMIVMLGGYLLLRNKEQLKAWDKRIADSFKTKQEGHVVYELPKITTTNRIISEHHIIQEQTITIGDYDLENAYEKYLLIKELNK